MDNEAAAVKQAFLALDEAFERRDLDAALALCTEDVVFIGSGQARLTECLREQNATPAVLQRLLWIRKEIEGVRRCERS
ncbi:MAG: nuclear transport factor 2 family protein [Actinobacteria bacterium]|nr:nuclear transport factor 2 family protein [Actinomycetota bacterium]